MRSSLRGQERGDDTEINDQDPNPDIWRKKPPIKVSKPSIDPRTSSGMLPPPFAKSMVVSMEPDTTTTLYLLYSSPGQYTHTHIKAVCSRVGQAGPWSCCPKRNISLPLSRSVGSCRKNGILIKVAREKKALFVIDMCRMYILGRNRWAVC